jgi:putative ABC transport system substrate-binding protein
MISRRGVLAAAIGFITIPLRAHAQPAGKGRRIGYLSLGPVVADRLAALREGLRTLGYVEGESVRIEVRHAAGRLDRLPDLAAELVRLNVDVIVTSGSALAAKKVTNTVPIVFIAEPDPVGTGLVASLAHPGGNVTGLADAHADLVPKRLDLLKEIVPSASRIGVLFNPTNPSTASQMKIAQTAGPALGVTILPIHVKGPGREDIDRAFAAMGKERLGALLVIGDQSVGVHRGRIAELALKQRLPTSGTVKYWAEAGLLMAYGADFVDVFRRAAVHVDKILKGAKPADLPVEQPTKFQMFINVATAKALGLTIPPSLMARVDGVIE